MSGYQEVAPMARSTRRYSAKLKFQVVLEALRGEKTPGQIAKAYGIHPNTVGLWKHMLLERGPEIFDGASGSRDSERRIADLEQVLGKKEVEIALLKNFLGRNA
jgi:transposase-like protein